MNTFIQTRSNQNETSRPGDDLVEALRDAYQNSADQALAGLPSLKATFRRDHSLRDGLKLTHWRKVRRSMLDD